MTLNPRITEWKNRRVWIVGASSGIGHALARLLLEHGARVAMSARSPAALEALVQAYPAQGLSLPMDVTSAEDWQRAYGSLMRAWGGLDQWIYAAADYQPMRAWELDMAKAERMVATNLTAALRGTATVLPDMLSSRSGAISLIASVAGYTGLPKSLVYGPTKAALINFAESLYVDVHPRGVAVSIINPGFVDTPLTQGNDFHMPALLTPEEAAMEIMTGLSAGEFEIHFPKRFTRWLRLIRRLPYSLRFRLLKEVAEKS